MNVKICVVALFICVSTVAAYSLPHKTYEKYGMREANARVPYQKNQDVGARSGNGRDRERLSNEISVLARWFFGAINRKDNYYCHHWTAEDLVEIGPGGGVMKERKQCESHLGYVFTQGRNKYVYPNCGTCWCCKPQRQEYECYQWTTEDIEVLGAGKGTADTERARCEDDLGFIFTHGKNENYPGAGGCWCIQPKS